jgi:hypothetical protein
MQIADRRHAHEVLLSGHIPPDEEGSKIYTEGKG